MRILIIPIGDYGVRRQRRRPVSVDRCAVRDRAPQPAVPDRPRQPRTSEPPRAVGQAVRHQRRALRVRRQRRTGLLPAHDEGRAARAARRRRHQYARSEPVDARSFARRTTRWSKCAASTIGSSRTGFTTRTRCSSSIALDGGARGTVQLPGVGTVSRAQPAPRESRVLLHVHVLPPAAGALSLRLRRAEPRLVRRAARRHDARHATRRRSCSSRARTARACRCSSRRGAGSRSTARMQRS